MNNYTTPVLNDHNGDISKEWYIFFRYTHPTTGQSKEFQKRFDLNREKSKMGRYERGRAALKLTKDCLAEGWNPIEQTNIRDFLLNAPSSNVKNKRGKTPFSEALIFALEKKRPFLAKKTISAYVSVKDFAIAASKRIGLSGMPVGEIKRSHIRELLDQMQVDRQEAYDKEGKGKKFTGNAYNKYKEYLHGLFTELESQYDLDYNPCHNIPNRPEIKTKPHRHATKVEEKLIKEELKKKHIRFYVMLAIEELSELRPGEIFGLKIQDIDYLNQWFVVGAQDHAKTREARNTTIPDSLMPLLKLLNLEKYPKHYYIFSQGAALVPGTRRNTSNTSTKLWKRLVKDGLGINVTMYSFKGLGGDKKIAAGIDKKTVSIQMGHTTTEMTDRYLEREEERQRNLIKNYTPKFE